MTYVYNEEQIIQEVKMDEKMEVRMEERKEERRRFAFFRIPADYGDLSADPVHCADDHWTDLFGCDNCAVSVF